MADREPKNYATVPKNCHMWKQEEPDLELEIIKRYPEDSYPTHADDSARSLKKCSDCGQLYFYEMVEHIDWDDGNDPIYRTFIPVSSEKVADELALLSDLDILYSSPRIQKDWEKNGKRKLYWVKRKND